MLAPSYSDIFRSNAVKSGLAPIELSEVTLGELKAAVSAVNELTVDLEALEIRHPAGLTVEFELDAYARETLIGGLDDIARTLKRADKIAAYESRPNA